MDSRNNILSLLGLSLRGSRLAVGEEPVEAAARARDARVLLLAADAADNTRRRTEHFADAGQCMWIRVPFTKEELGRAVGRSSVALLAVTDIGLASAIVHKLADLDPERFSESAARLDVKAKRAAERRAEMEAHQKNLRQGKRKPKKAEAPEGAPAPQAAEKQEERKAPAGRSRKPAAPRSGRPGRDGSPAASAASGERRRGPGAKPGASGKSRPSKANRPKPKGKPNPYAHSRPVKKGKGSFRKKAD